MIQLIYHLKAQLLSLRDYLSPRVLIDHFFGSQKVIRKIEKDARNNFNYSKVNSNEQLILKDLMNFGFSRIPSLDNDTCAHLLDLIKNNGLFTLLGKESDKFDSPLFDGKIPDYKILDATQILSEHTMSKLISPALLNIAQNCTQMKMRVSWVNIYKTFARDLSSLPRGGKYVSFGWHFDNSGFSKTIKLMYLLSDVKSIDDGAFEIKSSGKRYKTLLNGLGNSRLDLNDFTDRSESVVFTGSKSDGAIFDVKCAHRGGASLKNDRTVVIVELIPSL